MELGTEVAMVEFGDPGRFGTTPLFCGSVSAYDSGTLPYGLRFLRTEPACALTYWMLGHINFYMYTFYLYLYEPEAFRVYLASLVYIQFKIPS